MSKNVTIKQYDGSSYDEILPKTSASQTTYSNTTSGMSATTVQGAVDELFTSVSNGKAAVASAITDKGISTSATASFSTMATNIRNISFNFSGATVTPDVLQTRYTAWDSTGTLITGTAPLSPKTYNLLRATVYCQYFNPSWQTIVTFPAAASSVTVLSTPTDYCKYWTKDRKSGSYSGLRYVTGNLMNGEQSIYYGADAGDDENYVYLWIYANSYGIFLKASSSDSNYYAQSRFSIVNNFTVTVTF